MTRALLLIPPHVDFAAINDQLHLCCQANGYEIAYVDRDHRPWWDVLSDAHRMRVDVILVADEAHLPADRTPRVEVADLSADRPDVRRRNAGPHEDRRPRPV